MIPTKGKRLKGIFGTRHFMVLCALYNWENLLADAHPDTISAISGIHPNVVQHSLVVLKQAGLVDLHELDNGNMAIKILANQKEAKPAKAFAPPTTEEVDAYFKEQGVDDPTIAAEFINFYELKGWRYGATRTPITDWKRAVNTWVTRRKKEAQERERRKQEMDARFARTSMDERNKRSARAEEMERTNRQLTNAGMPARYSRADIEQARQGA